jgi:hypothetical protein
VQIRMVVAYVLEDQQSCSVMGERDGWVRRRLWAAERQKGLIYTGRRKEDHQFVLQINGEDEEERRR